MCIHNPVHYKVFWYKKHIQCTSNSYAVPVLVFPVCGCLCLILDSFEGNIWDSSQDFVSTRTGHRRRVVWQVSLPTVYTLKHLHVCYFDRFPIRNNVLKFKYDFKKLQQKIGLAV